MWFSLDSQEATSLSPLHLWNLPLQGIAWVREREKEKGLVILRLDQKDMLRKLEMVRV